MATVLFEVEGYSIREVAEILKCSEGAVKFNIHEGRKKLKRRLFHLVRGTRWGRKRAEDEELESGAEDEFQRDGSTPDRAAEKGAGTAAEKGAGGG